MLIIAEKPSVGRDIAKVLHCTQKGDGFLFSENTIVSWAIGHLVELCAPEDYDPKFKSWRPDTLPIIPPEVRLKPVESTKKQFNVLKKLFAHKDVETLVCATDSGREGELIFRYIYTLLGSTKPVERLWISSMTEAAIKAGFANLKPGAAYDHLYQSAKCRSEADWLVGINATRAYTLKYDTLLSVGRVQTPTLAILVNRQKEINAFVAAPYFEVEAVFEGYKGLWTNLETNESKIQDKEAAEALVAKVTGQTGQVTAIDTEEKKQPPGYLFDLTQLQRDCNRFFGLSAKDTLGVAQDLYEKYKLITYPRTDSRFLSDDMVPKLPIILKMLARSGYESQAKYVLELPKLPISKRIVDNSKVTDHHAIIPTEKAPKLDSLPSRHLQVYDLIVRQFLAVFYPYYETLLTRITTTVEGEAFITKGTTVVAMGFMALFKEVEASSKKKEDDENLLPTVAVGDSQPVQEASVLSKKTTPPKPYTEAALLSAMENAGRFVEDEDLKAQLKDSGLGTPATRAAIIERLLQVGYAVRKGKSLIPTEKGMALIHVAPKELTSPETTGKWEKGLSSISKGTMAPERFMQSIEKYVRFLVQDAKTTPTQAAFPQEERKRKGKAKSAGALPSLGQCPKCGGDVLENSKSYYCARWKQGCHLSIWKDQLTPYGQHLTPDLVKKLLETKTIENLPVILPQTREKAVATLTFTPDMSGKVQLLNLKRIAEERSTNP